MSTWRLVWPSFTHRLSFTETWPCNVLVTDASDPHRLAEVSRTLHGNSRRRLSNVAGSLMHMTQRPREVSELHAAGGIVQITQRWIAFRLACWQPSTVESSEAPPSRHVRYLLVVLKEAGSRHVIIPWLERRALADHDDIGRDHPLRAGRHRLAWRTTQRTGPAHARFMASLLSSKTSS